MSLAGQVLCQWLGKSIGLGCFVYFGVRPLPRRRSGLCMFGVGPRWPGLG